METDHVFAPEVEKELEKLSPKKPKVEPKKESKSKIAPTSFYSPKGQHAPAVKGKKTISANSKLKVDISSVSKTSTSKAISQSSLLPKMSKYNQDLLIKDTSNGKTSYRDQYGWFTVAKPKKQKSSTKQSKIPNVFLTPRTNSKKFSATREKSLASNHKWISKSSLIKSTSYAKTQLNDKSTQVIEKPLIVDSNGIVMNLKNKPLVRKPHLYTLIDSTNPKGPIQRWVPRKP